MLRIQINTLKPGLHEFTLAPEPEALDLDPETFADLRVEVRLDLQPGRILALLAARATATLECDRTLVQFEQEVQGTHQVLFAAPEFAPAEGGEGHDDVYVLQPFDQEIDLTEPARDTLLLALPARRVAPGAEDVDLPNRFGEPSDPDDAVDPRWEALRALRQQQEDHP